jgi:small conductance mechanosensitive channel
LWEVISLLIERSLTREEEKQLGSTRKMTLLPLLRNVVRISLGVIATMLVLSHVGINIGPLLAGAGVVGLAVGFGAQTLVRDVITGAFILLEDAISVGDWVTVAGYSGTVEGLSVRTMTLRDLSGTVYMIPFSEVTSVTNFNRGYGYALIDAAVAYRERYEEVVQALRDVAKELKEDESWGRYITGDLEVFGMNNLGDSAVEIRVRLRTLPMRQFAVRRAFLEHMKKIFDERGIEIPFPHHTIWFGVDKEGAAPPVYIAEKDKKAITPPGENPPEG